MADQFESVRVHKYANKKFDTLCKRYNRARVDLFAQMVEFFLITNIDPLEVSVSTKGKTYSQLRRELGKMLKKGMEEQTRDIEEKLDEVLGLLKGKGRGEQSSQVFDLISEYEEEVEEVGGEADKSIEDIATGGQEEADGLIIPE